jgi:hypothetical protein
MAKINFNNIDWEDDESASYEKFTKSNRKPSQNEDVFEPSGKPRRGRKGDSFISQRTKSRT